MKPFNLDEYLANPNRKVVTLNGRSVRIICTDRNDDFCRPIVALVKGDHGEEDIFQYTKDGESCVSCARNLYFELEKKVGWINIYHGKDGSIVGNVIFASKEEAEESKKHCCGFTQGLYLTTAKIEWEE